MMVEIAHSRTCAFLAVVVAMVLAGCAQDPAVAKARYYESGQKYLEEQKYQEAAIEFRNALKFDPRFAEAHFRLGLTQLKLRQWAEAYRSFNTVVELQPSLIPARIHLAELLLRMKKTTEARLELGELLADHPENPAGQALLAQTYLVENDYPQAIKEFGKAMELDPQNAFLWSARGLAEMGVNQFALAEKDFWKAIELDPSSSEGHRNLATLFRLTGRHHQVEPLLQRALEANPQSIELYLSLGDFYLGQGRLEEIESLFAPLRGRASDFPGLRRTLGDFWLWRNEAERAASEYEAALAEGRDPIIRKKLVSAYLTLGRLKEAEGLNQAILKKNPTDAQGRSFRGALSYLRGDYAGAARELQAVVKDDPLSPFGYYYLGLSWLGLNKPYLARQAFFECVRLQENFFHAYKKLAELALGEGDGKGGSEYARKLVELNPRSPDGYLLLAQAHMTEGDLRRAESVLRQVSRLPSQPVELHEVAARLYALQDRDAAAIAEYEKALARASHPFVILTRYANFHVARGRTHVAIERAKKWMEGRPAQAKHYELLARRYLQQRDFGSAVAAARKALELGPRRWGPHWLLGQIYAEQGQLEEALVQYNETIRLNRSLAPPHILAGDILMRQGASAGAKGYYQAALRQAPDSWEAQHALSRWYAERGENLDRALGMAQELKRRLPEDPEISDTLGWLYSQKGIYGLALEQLRSAAEALPDDARVQFHLGMTFYQMEEEPAQAREALKRAVELGLEPGGLAVTAEQALAQLEGKEQ